MRLYAILCYSIGALAESVGFVLVLLSLRSNRKLLETWRSANPEGHRGGSYGQINELNGVVSSLLDEGRWRTRIAMGLLALGILAGTLGNFTGLPS